MSQIAESRRQAPGPEDPHVRAPAPADLGALRAELDERLASVEELRDMAQEMGTRMIGCTMAIDVMGVDAAEFVDGIELGGVATFMEEALRSRFTLFI